MSERLARRARSARARSSSLRPRERATVIVVLVGVPLLVAFAAARILPDVLWFKELGQLDVFTRIQVAKGELFVIAGGAAALLLGANFAIALSHLERPRTDAVRVAAAAVSLITASFFASSATGCWQPFLLWCHRQSFGVTDPMYGKDVGYFVFSYPFEVAVAGKLLLLIAVAALFAAFVYRAGDALSVRPLRATYAAQVHLGTLAAIFLLVLAWRLRLERYTLELVQPSPHNGRSFAGPGYVDAHVRSPVLAAGSILAVVLAVACLFVPHHARTNGRRAKLLVAVPAGLALGVAVAGGIAPALVQRFIVAPSELAHEGPYLNRSIAATRTALGLDAIGAHVYAPTGALSATDVSQARNRLANVQVWDPSLLEARARQLVADTPYYRPGQPTLDIVRVDGRRMLTVASARELDLRPVGGVAKEWSNERLAYTHGLGQVRFSGTDIEPNRQPRLLDAGLKLREPRVYFGDLRQARARPRRARGAKIPTEQRTAESPWVVAPTRRPEVDISASRSSYHYGGTGGVALSSWMRRAAFALETGSMALLLSHTITPDSRLLLHRDVHDRLRTLAPFVQWDAHPAALTANGHIVFVVDGYTTSDRYPGAERVDLGGARVNYARASVRATINAFSGQVNLYLTDRRDPIARAWAETFPTLFRPADEMPDELRGRLGYPPDLFAAQATAYETFHATQPAQFASGGDAWSRPIALAGGIEVAGSVDFDESDEDDLRLTMQPGYAFSPPPGQRRPRLLLETYYSPRRAQNLVATLSGWVGADGRARLAARSLPRDRVNLGPAQVSRQVFGTPRVRNLLGLSNREVADLNKSSLDSVILGQPHLLFLPGGTMQTQSLYEGSRGPGAARLIGVTAYLNGRAGLGSDIQDAVRQALHKPPKVTVLRPRGPIFVGRPVKLELVATNVRRAAVTISSAGGTDRANVALRTGRGTFRWVPSDAGQADVRVEAEGLDGSPTAARTAFRVLSRPPAVDVTRAPRRAVVGRPVRVLFKVRHSVGAVVDVSTRSGIELTRRYRIRQGTGVVNWTPRTAGRAVLRIRTSGRQGQSATRSARFAVAPAPRRGAAPTVTLVQTPKVATVGRAHAIVFRTGGCRDAVARIDGDGEQRSAWRFRCGARPIKVNWSPRRPGRYLLTVTARARRGATSQTAIPLKAKRRA